MAAPSCWKTANAAACAPGCTCPAWRRQPNFLTLAPMKFGRVPLAEAAGAILAHGVPPFRKGRVLSHADLEVLKAAGVGGVTAARLEDGDVPEDQAAARVARALAGPH